MQTGEDIISDRIVNKVNSLAIFPVLRLLVGPSYHGKSKRSPFEQGFLILTTADIKLRYLS